MITDFFKRVPPSRDAGGGSTSSSSNAPLSSSGMTSGPSLLDAMAMEEVMNADAGAMVAAPPEATAADPEVAAPVGQQSGQGGIPIPPPVWGVVSDVEPEPPAMRFWNQRLKPLYDSCLLPVRSAPFAPHHHAEGAYRFSFTYQDGNQNWTFAATRPAPPGPASPSLSERMRPR
eukprot:5892954-Prymnesium_polylepis.1